MTKNPKARSKARPSLLRCPECGGAVRPHAAAGRRMTYKNISGLKVPAALELPTCDRCGEQWINDTAAAAIDAAMEPVYRARLREIARRAITTITAVVSQGELERKLGMTQGYLTKLKNGHRDPSPEVAIQLSMIALHPKRRLREIDKILSEGEG
jgi:hypothetical protein